MSDDAFDAGAVRKRVEDICDKLGELWGIDQVLKEKWDGQFYSAFLREQQENEETVGFSARIEIGRTAPFDEHIYVPGSIVGPDETPLGYSWSYRREIAEDYARDKIEEGIEKAKSEILPWLESLASILDARSHEFTSASDDINADVELALKSAVVDDFAGLQKSVVDWEGDAADQFATYFHNRMQAASHQQVFLAEGIRAIILAGQVTVSHAQQSLYQLTSTIDAILDDQLNQRKETHEPKGWSTGTWLLAAATVVALVAAVPTGGGSVGALSATVAVAGASNGLLQFGARLADNADAEEQTIEVAYSSDVLEQLTCGFDDIVDRYRDNWDNVETNLSTPIRGWMDNAIAKNWLWPARPDLTDSPTPGEFYHESKNY